MIIVDNIHFTSTCEHHMAPFRGTAHVAYIPNPESRIITGLSKISRVVTLFARRLQIQERMTQQIAPLRSTITSNHWESSPSCRRPTSA